MRLFSIVDILNQRSNPFEERLETARERAGLSSMEGWANGSPTKDIMTKRLNRLVESRVNCCKE